MDSTSLNFAANMISCNLSGNHRAFLLLLAVVAPDAVGGEATLRVATWNLNWGNRNNAQIVEAITSADADIILLQETTESTELGMDRALRAEYSYRRVFAHSGRYRAERFSVLSRLPVSDARFYPPDEESGFFGFVSLQARLGSRTIRCVNVHLAPFTLKRPHSLSALMKQLGATEETHVREIEAVLRTVDQKLPTIVAGDFNSLSSFQAPVQLRQAGFVDSFASVTQSPDRHPTWYWPLRIGEAKLRIDYVFHSDHFSTQDCRIAERSGSDHCMLISTLTLKDDGD